MDGIPGLQKTEAQRQCNVPKAVILLVSGTAGIQTQACLMPESLSEAWTQLSGEREGRQVLCSWNVDSGQVPTYPASEPRTDPEWGDERLDHPYRELPGPPSLSPPLSHQTSHCSPSRLRDGPELLPLQSPCISHCYDPASSQVSPSHEGL